MTQKGDSETFCPILWNHAACSTNGNQRACCVMDNELTKSDGTFYNWKTDSILEGFNNSEMKRMRLEMLEGKRLSECHRCWRAEETGGTSRRTHTIATFRGILTEEIARSHTDNSGATDLKPTFWDVRFGNLCNLKCVMCHPDFSTQWIKDWELLKGESYEHGEYDWWKADNFWQQLEELGSSIRQIQLAGGEPLMIERQYDFLQMLVDRGWSKDITLEYDTNLTNIQDRALTIWNNFKSLNVRISIEDTGERNRYIRFPSNYDKIIENTLRIKQEVTNSKYFISCTWQVLNAFTVTDLIDDLNTLGINFNARILSDPYYYDVKILPRDIKLQILEHYYNWKGNRKIIQPLINYIEQHLDYEDLEAVRIMIKFNDQLDKIRGTNWRETFTELQRGLEMHIDNNTGKCYNGT